MGSIPRYSRVVLETKATPSKISSAGAGARAVSQVAGQAQDLATNYALKQKQAREANWMNEQSVNFQKEHLNKQQELQETFRENPVGYSDAVDKWLVKRRDDIKKSAPSDTAKESWGRVADKHRLDMVNSSKSWERTREVENFGVKLNDSITDLNDLAFSFGDITQLDPLLNQVEAATVAGSTFMSPKVMKDVNDKAIKSVTTNLVNGILTKNPLEALEVIKQKNIQKIIGADGIAKLNTAATNRIKNLSKNQAQQEIIQGMGIEGSLLEESLTRNLSLVEIEQVSENLTEQAKSLLYKQNGYSDKKDKKTPSQKIKGKSDFMSVLAKFDNTSGKKADDYKKMQDAIFKSMDSNFLTPDEGADFLAELVGPYANKISEDLKTFSEEYLNVDNSLGFGRIEEYFSESVDTSNWYRFFEGDEEIAQNDRNKIDLYNYYYDSLKEQAGEKLSNLEGLSKFPAKERQLILDNAYNSSVTRFAEQVGLGSFDDANEATQAITKDAQNRARDAGQKAIDSAILQEEVKIKLNEEEEKFLEGFGL